MRVLWCLVWILVLPACLKSSVLGPDGGVDSGPDAVFDSAFDVAPDAPRDGGSDARRDAFPDSRVDGGGGAARCDVGQRSYLTMFDEEISASTTRCGAQCLSAPASDARECFVLCFGEHHPDLRDNGCSECVADRTGCVSEGGCLAECLPGLDSEGCILCQCDIGCQSTFDDCAGTSTAAACR